MGFRIQPRTLNWLSSTSSCRNGEFLFSCKLSSFNHFKATIVPSSQDCTDWSFKSNVRSLWTAPFNRSKRMIDRYCIGNTLSFSPSWDFGITQTFIANIEASLILIFKWGVIVLIFHLFLFSIRTSIYVYKCKPKHVKTCIIDLCILLDVKVSENIRTNAAKLGRPSARQCICTKTI